MEFDQLTKLINTVSASDLSEFCYEENGVKLRMKKARNVVEVNEVQTLPVKTEKVPEQKEEQTKCCECGNEILSPLVGTFYAAPSEDAAPYVQVGDHVKKGQTLAIIEAMKLMNEIESDYDGVVTEILAENGKPVEYGEVLFRIE